MSVVDKYAELNRRTMIETILGKMGVKTHKMKISTTKHNYIDQEHKMLRKGAIAAYADEEVIISFSVNESTLDESPMVYKSAKEIESLIADTVEVREHLKPLYNFKAGS